MQNSNKENIIKLQEIISNRITPLINNDFVLLDIPNHRNIGDSLIWKGELEYFKTLKYKCLRQFNRYTFKNNHIQSENTVILLHGGGNFGDIYPSSQNFKKEIVSHFPDNRIIIMPQTIFYEEESKKIGDFELFRKHKDLYICVRDIKSYDLISDLFPKERILLTPDMAFFIDLDKYITKNDVEKALFLNRTDAEKVDDKYLTLLEGQTFDTLDWPTYNSSNNKLNVLSNYIEALDGKLSKRLKYVPIINRFIDDAYGFKNRNNMELHIKAGIDFINEYSRVYTTRLHGMILSVLLDKEIVILDNSYGKNRGFYEAWLKGFQKLTLV